MTPDHDEILRALLRDKPQIMAYLWSFVRDVHLSEDLFQDICIAVINKSDQITHVDKIEAWVRSAVRYEALRALRKQRTEQFIFREDTQDLLDKVWAQEMESHTCEDLIDALRMCLTRLTPYARKIIELRYKFGLTGEALAQALDRKAATVYTALSRAHSALAQCIKHQQASGEGGERG